MNHRQRFLQTMHFQSPDKIPFEPGGPRESTLAAWHTQGLPSDVHWMEHLAELLVIPETHRESVTAHGIQFHLLPTFEEKVLEHANGHYIVQDWMGAITEISDQ